MPPKKKPRQEQTENITTNSTQNNFWSRPRGKLLMGVLIAIVAAPFVAFIGIKINSVISPTADVEVSFSPRSAVPGKVRPQLAADGSSGPIQTDVFLENHGNLRVTGLNMSLFFRTNMLPRVIEGKLQPDNPLKGLPVFIFENTQTPLYAKSERQVGAFEISIPRKSSEEELLAMDEVHGDFGSKRGFLIYDRKNDEYITKKIKNTSDATNKWNEYVYRDKK